uniref:B box-type domain-containing protein n=1 Tax=Trichuris muris TaxID=70415 RepID=A0A5S6QJ11_TRIMR
MDGANCYGSKEDSLDDSIPSRVINYLDLNENVDASCEIEASLESLSTSKWQETNGDGNDGKTTTDYAQNTRRSSGGGSEDSLEWNCDVDMVYRCAYCRKPYEQPRLLECLHSFCESCIIAMLEAANGRSMSGPLENCRNENKTPPGVVKCPTCNQGTNVGNDLRWVKQLKPDFVMANLLASRDLKQTAITCESCKAEEPALARCLECACFLCSNCISAHNYMKCFDDHKVVSLESLKASNEVLVIHRPITCQEHTGELLKYYCRSCNVVICAQCARLVHSSPDHCAEKLKNEHADHVRDRLQQLCCIAERKEKVLLNVTGDVSARLQSLHDNVEGVRSEIEGHFDYCLHAIQSARDMALQQLENVQADTERQVIENFRKVRNTSEKITDACDFAYRLLKYGNALELLISDDVASNQLMQLVHSIPSVHVSPSIVFLRDQQLSNDILTRTFGYVTVHTNELCAYDVLPLDQMTSLLRSSDCNPTMQAQNSAQVAGFNISQQASPSDVVGPQSDLQNCGHSVKGNNSSSALVRTSMYGNNASSMSSIGNVDALASATELVNLPNANFARQSIGEYVCSRQNRERLPSEMLPSTSADGVVVSNQLPMFINARKFCLSVLESQSAQANPHNAAITVRGQETENGSGSYRIVDPVTLTSCSGLNRQFRISPSSSTLQPDVQAPPIQSPYKPNLIKPPSPRTWEVPLAEVKMRCGTNGSGAGQFNSPHGFCISNDDELIIADTNNHRIQVLSAEGEYKYQFGTSGREDGYLWYPRKVALTHDNGVIIVCDRGPDKSRIQFFSRKGTFLRCIHLKLVDIVAGLAVDEDGSLVIVDSSRRTVFCIDQGGELSRWFTCHETFEPSELAIYQHEYFICDFKGHAVCVYTSTGTFSRRIGNNNLTPFPNGICILRSGNILVGDSHGNHFHIAEFKASGDLEGERQCLSLKVSRCSGLGFTKDGSVVTLLKNNHCVLILKPIDWHSRQRRSSKEVLHHLRKVTIMIRRQVELADASSVVEDSADGAFLDVALKLSQCRKRVLRLLIPYNITLSLC